MRPAKSPSRRMVERSHQIPATARCSFGMSPAAADAQPQILAQKLEQLWDDLASFDAGKAHRAFWTMAARPRDSVGFLNKRMSPVRVPDDRLIEQLIADLNDGQFVKRQKALRQLNEIVDVAEPNLRAALKSGSQTLEGHRRIESLLHGLAETSPKKLLQRRAIAVLEVIGTTEAKTILESLACGARGAQLTRESRAARIVWKHTKSGSKRFGDSRWGLPAGLGAWCPLLVQAVRDHTYRERE